MTQHEGCHEPVRFAMDASPAPLKRSFEIVFHERLSFPRAKHTDSLSTVFDGSRYDRQDQQRVLVEFKPNGKESSTDCSDRLTEISYHAGDQYSEDVEHNGSCDHAGEHESSALYLVVCGGRGRKVHSRGLKQARRAQSVSIADGVEELYQKCFARCKSLCRVTFGKSSSLKLIGKGTFRGSGVRAIQIPNGVEVLP